LFGDTVSVKYGSLRVFFWERHVEMQWQQAHECLYNQYGDFDSSVGSEKESTALILSWLIPHHRWFESRRCFACLPATSVHVWVGGGSALLALPDALHCRLIGELFYLLPCSTEVPRTHIKYIFISTRTYQ
jgi:hypothetical protein